MNVDATLSTETPSPTTAPSIESSTAIPSDASSIWWPSLTSRASLLRTVLLDPPRHWSLVPLQFQQDPSFIIQFLEAQGALPNATAQLPSKDDFERNFTPAIRQNRQVLLAWTRRPDFALLYEQRHLYVPESWLGDKEIMLAYAAAIPRSLQECADALRDDRDMVVTSIQRNGMELQYAAVQWQQDETIVRMACANHLGALEFCSSPALRTQLLQDYDFVLSLLEQCREDDDGTYIPYAAKVIRSLKEPMRSHPDLLLTALHLRIFSLSDLPIKFQKDYDFVLAALERRASIYLENGFRASWNNDLGMAKAAIRSPTSTSEIIAAVLEQFPDLQIHPRTETALIEALVDRADAVYMKTLVTEVLPHTLHDPRLMVRAVQRDPTLYQLCFCQDVPEIVKNAMTPSTAASIIHSKPMEYRVEHEDVVVQALAVTDNIMLLEYVVPDAVWAASQSLQKAWLRRSGVWRRCFGTVIDRDMALWVAQHAPCEFHKLPLSAQLRRKVDFIKEALVVSGGFIWSQIDVGTMPRTIECAVSALSANASESALIAVTATYSRETLRLHLQAKLADWDRFFLVRCAIALDRGDDGCVLPLLHLGNETGLALQQHIAEFLGIQPLLRVVHLYEQAYRRLYKEYQTPPWRTTTGTSMTTTATVAAMRPRNLARRRPLLRAARAAAQAGPRARIDEILGELEMVEDLRENIEDDLPGIAAMMMDIDEDDVDLLEVLVLGRRRAGDGIQEDRRRRRLLDEAHRTRRLLRWF
jgi:hypothetical protein